MIPGMLSPRFLYRFTLPCRRKDPIWSASGAQLGEECRLPNLVELDGRLAYADVRVAWHAKGIALAVRVAGKRQSPWCRDARPEESDGLRVWIDTRDTHTVHRAGRFCHQFMFMPAGSGRSLDEPFAEQLFIHRAKEHAKAARFGTLQVRREKRVDGYIMECFIPESALTGYDPTEHPRLGFTYAVVDRELGEQSLSCDAAFPYREDPSLWATLELIGV